MSEMIVKMPPLGESVTEATISTWLVHPGDKVKKYDPILEAMSDKVTTEIPASDDGEISELLVEEGDVVKIGDDILKMTIDGESSASTQEEPSESKPQEINLEVAKAEPQVSTQPSVQKTNNNHQRYSPAVVAIASEKNIDLSQVAGTGKNGRITRKDVLNFNPEIATTPAPQTESSKSNKMASDSIPAANSNNDNVKKTTPIRKAIAQNMLRSVQEVPQAWTMIEVDVTELVNLRNSVKAEFKKRNGYSLSFFPFFVKAVSMALMNHPKLNSSWQGDEIIEHQDINISIAVATEDALFVPVIKHTNNLSIAGIASEINRLATDVRNNKLKGDDMTGGTFTVNNTGSFGSVESMGIINYPQAAILQVETIRKEVSVLSDNTFGIRNKINLCLTLDHRLLDGLAAGNFLKEVKKNLEEINQDTSVY